MSLESSTDTMKSAKRKEKLTRGLLFAISAASLGSFQTGYALWLVHNSSAVLLDFPNSTFERTPTPTIPKYRQRLLKMSTMIYTIGGILGAILIGYLVDTWGRKRALVVANYVNIFASFFVVLSRLTKELKFAIFARFVFGTSAGITFCVVPLYIVEISPPHKRGSLFMISILCLTFGAFIAQLISFRESLNIVTGAAFYMSLTGIVAICNIIMWHYVPESPRFLFIQQEDESAAREALKKLRGESNLEEELEEMRVESICERDKKHLNAVKLLSCRDLQKPLLSAVLLMMGNQLTGINGVYVYAERVYTNMRFEGRHIRFSLIVVNVIMHVALIIMTNFIDYMGRRFLLLLGFMVCSITCIILAVTLEFQAQYMSVMPYFSSFVIIIFLIGHMIGPGPLPFLLTGELFLQSSRGTAYMLSGFMNWLTRTLVSVIFIFLEPEIGPYSLVLFWPFCVGIFIYVFKKVPETKGRTFVEIWKGTGSPKRMQKKSSRKKDKSQPKRVK